MTFIKVFGLQWQIQSSASSALKTERKLNATSLKILKCMVQIFTTSQQDICAQSSSNFLKFIYKIFLSWLTVFHPPSKIRAIYSGNFRDIFRRHKNLKICDQAQSTREEGVVSSAFFWKLKGMTLLLRENAQIMVIYGYVFHQKCSFFNLSEKAPKVFSMRLFVCLLKLK